MSGVVLKLVVIVPVLLIFVGLIAYVVSGNKKPRSNNNETSRPDR